MYREVVLTTGTVGNVTIVTLVAVVLEDGQDAAAIHITVLNDLVDGEVFAELGNREKVGLSLNSLLGKRADVVPGLALAGGGSLIIRLKDWKGTLFVIQYSYTSKVW